MASQYKVVTMLRFKRVENLHGSRQPHLQPLAVSRAPREPRTHTIRPKRVPLTTEQWRGYFLRNADTLLNIPWSQGLQLATVERDAIASSIQEFQLGESG